MNGIMHEQVSLPGGSPIKVKWDDCAHFTFPWHFHSEYEIVYVEKSYGKRFVADNIEYFKEGDLVMVGSNVPHFWKSDDVFYQEKGSDNVHAVVVQFSEHFLSGAIHEYPELQKIKELFKRAERGICFLSPDSESIGKKLKTLLDKKGFDRFLEFLHILGIMAETKNFRLLGTELYNKTIPTGTDEKLSGVLNYLNINYQDDISLKDLSDKFGMNSTAFCRYFKKRTSKSLTRYIHELRIGYACRLLQEGKMSIYRICFECGFNNISHFNRVFKRITNYKPSQYIDNSK